MFKKQLIIIFLCLFLNSYAQTEFITIWKPNVSGSVDNAIAYGGTGTSYNITWEEVGYPQHAGAINAVTSMSSNPLVISFGTSLNPNPVQATYKVKASNGNGLFYGFRANVDYIEPNQEILEVSQWGATSWLQQFTEGFVNCPNFNVTAVDTPDLSQITDLSMMFYNCPALVGNSSFSNWNISNVTNMNGMFMGATLFNQNIGNWNTAHVTNFDSMFNSATSFNQNISAWNMSSAVNLTGMFKDAVTFNQPLNSWNTSNATTFRYVFANATSFNQPLNNWNTGKAIDFEHMFENAVSFNQPIGNWDVSKVSYFAGFNMFNGAALFDQDISNWNIKLQNFTWNSIGFGFKNSGLSCINYNKFLIALNNNTTWPISTITSGSIDATGLIYSTPQAIVARAQLINKGFNIIGDNYNPSCNLATTEVPKAVKTVTYPNPTTGLITVESTVNEKVYLYDSAGRIIKNMFLNKGKNLLDLAGIPSGHYVLKGNTVFTNIIKK